MCDDCETQQLLYEYGLNYTNIFDQLVPSEEEQDCGQTWNDRLRSVHLEEDQVILAFFRHQILQCLDRLQTCRELLLLDPTISDMANVDLTNKPISKFASSFFHFRDVNLVQQALYYARQQNYGALNVLFIRHGCDLLPYRFRILDAIPETANPENYKSILPAVDARKNQETTWLERKWRQQDWAETDVILNQLSLTPPDKSTISKDVYPAPASLVRDWYDHRIRSIERQTGLTNFATDLCDLARSKQVPELDKLSMSLALLSNILYEDLRESIFTSDILEMSLSDLENRTAEELTRVLTQRGRAEYRLSKRMETFAKDFHGHLLPVLKLKLGFSPNDSALLEFLVNRASSIGPDPMEFILLCLSAWSQKYPISFSSSLVALAVKCMEHYESGSSWQTIKDITLLLAKSECVNNDEELGKNLEQLRTFAEVSLTVSSYVKAPSPVDIAAIFNDSENQRRFFLRITVAILDTAEATSLSLKYSLEYLLQLRKMFGCFGCSVVSLEKLFFSTALTIPQLLEPTKELLFSQKEDNTRFLLQMTENEIKDIILKASKEFFDNAEHGNVDNGGLCHALMVLKTVPGTVSASFLKTVQQEIDFIRATSEVCSLLVDQDSFALLPIQVRLEKDKLAIVKRCLRCSQDFYRRKKYVLEIARKLLRIKDFEHDARIKDLVQLFAYMIQTAIERNDPDIARSHCLELAEICDKLPSAVLGLTNDFKWFLKKKRYNIRDKLHHEHAPTPLPNCFLAAKLCIKVSEKNYVRHELCHELLSRALMLLSARDDMRYLHLLDFALTLWCNNGDTELLNATSEDIVQSIRTCSLEKVIASVMDRHPHPKDLGAFHREPYYRATSIFRRCDTLKLVPGVMALNGGQSFDWGHEFEILLWALFYKPESFGLSKDSASTAPIVACSLLLSSGLDWIRSFHQMLVCLVLEIVLPLWN